MSRFVDIRLIFDTDDQDDANTQALGIIDDALWINQESGPTPLMDGFLKEKVQP